MGNCRSCGCYPAYRCSCRSYRHYGFFNFAFDLFMIFITCGVWLLWIFIREMRNR